MAFRKSINGTPAFLGLLMTLAAGPAVASDSILLTAFGAVPNDGQDDTAALREALREATRVARRNGGAVLQLPPGVFDLTPVAGEGWVWIFRQSQPVVVQGAGQDETILRVHAAPTQNSAPWRNPADPITDRGGLFQLRGDRARLTVKDLTIDGQAPPTADAGKYPGFARTGWDTSHKAIGCWDGFDELRLERVHVRRFRGEMVYAGGGERNGEVILIDCVLSECNASAISCTASMTIEGLELYDAYNGIENFLFPGDRFEMRRSLLEPGRNFLNSKFGAVFLGPRNAEILIEDCVIESGRGVGQNASGPLHFAEFCHQVTVRDTVLANGVSGAHRVGISNYAAMQAEHPGFSGIHFERVVYRASWRHLSGHYRYGEKAVDWSWTRCTVRLENGFRMHHLGQFPGGCVGRLEGNDWSDLSKLWETVLYYNRTQRAHYTGDNLLPVPTLSVYQLPPSGTVLHGPSQPGPVRIGAWPAPEKGVRLRVDPRCAPAIPEPLQVEYHTRRTELELEWPTAEGVFDSARLEPNSPILLTFQPLTGFWSREH